ncbi:hypothetical protein [Zobellia galactanivorans]|uniref:Uncharacterized protein n=1 Tax=Zobellia galactanivorans (strain DSM 12802 / CCUG 47099 / CIP 106680 / NCIMB 13871 / Dsij) TaxID=63186 RepID=G0L783_ZOBGA|nr:hypothetical protein [Zobellia galactanivorans]CAZ97214.1 Putative protein [Zobellia galactanivorans]
MNKDDFAGSVPQRDKTKHEEGDLHYGYSDIRYAGMDKMMQGNYSGQ